MLYFQNVYPDIASFKADVVIYLTSFDKNKNNIFNFDINDYRYATLETLFLWINRVFISRPLRYDKVTFKTLFWTTFIEHYPNLYTQQLVYANKELEQLANTKARGTSSYSIPTGKVLNENISASTNVGKLKKDQSPFELQGEAIYQKTGNKSIASYDERKTENYQTDLYLNALAITNSTMNFGLQQFCSNFIYLAKKIFVPNLLFKTSGDEPTPVPQDIKFDQDTIKKINGKYRVVGIKDE